VGRFDFKVLGMGLLALIMVVMVVGMMRPLNTVGDPTKRASKIEQIIDKAMIQCYALEGSYPGSLESLTSYGVVIDKTSYNYYFEAIGSNIKPIIKVFPK